MERFWVLWVEDSPEPPRRRHSSFEAAEAEAKRLAIKEGRRVLILETVAALERPAVVRVPLWGCPSALGPACVDEIRRD